MDEPNKELTKPEQPNSLEDFLSNVPKDLTEILQTVLKNGKDIILDALQMSKQIESQFISKYFQMVTDFITQKQKRDVDQYEDASLVGLIYIDMFLRLSGQPKSSNCMLNYFCTTSKAAKKISHLADKMSIYLSQFASELLAKTNDVVDPKYLHNITLLSKADQFDCDKKFPGC